MLEEGRLSREEFNVNLEDFLQRSKTLGDGWEGRLGPEYLQVLLGNTFSVVIYFETWRSKCP